jgi:hypothetical protein
LSAETDHILHVFHVLLTGPTGDGKTKRDAGLKEHWSTDPTHEGAAQRHIDRWLEGETIDPDSGCHPLVHAAWRLLAVAYQELADRGEAPLPPHPHVETVGQRAFWQDVKEQSRPSIGARAEGEDFVSHDHRELPRNVSPYSPDFNFGGV